MRAILINNDELDSPRWHRLCDLLGSRDPGDRWRTLGHLTGWYMRWSRQPEWDSGIWFRSSLNEIGSWADVPNGDLKWGRALLAAGYVGLLKNLYPEPLASLRNGYAALDASGGVMLDEFFGVLRRRANAPTLVCYMLDRNKRVTFARSLRIDATVLEGSGLIPEGWLTWTHAIGHSDPSEAGVTARPDMRADSLESDHPAVDPAGDRSIAAAHRVVGFSTSDSAATANDPTDAMLRTVREFKHSDPMRALLAIDGSPGAARVWRKAISKDQARVSEELSCLTETERKWRAFRNPAAVLTATFMQLGLLGNS